MKNRIKTVFSAAFILACATAPAQAPKGITISAAQYQPQAAPEVTLVRAGGMLRVAFDAAIPAGFLKSGEAYIITPQLANGEWKTSLPSVAFEGSRYRLLEQGKSAREARCDHRAYLERVPYKGKETGFHYQAEVPFAEAMYGAQLTLLLEKVDICGRGSCDAVPVERIALHNTVPNAGLLSDLILGNQVVYYLPAQIEATYTENFGHRSAFVLDHAALTAAAKESYDAFIARVKQAVAKEGAAISRVSILASASPEGPYKRNAKLAENRGRAMRGMVLADLGVDPAKVDVTVLAENWDDFLTAARAADLPNIATVERIAGMYANNLDRREANLLALENRNRIVDVFKNLRNCSITVHCNGSEPFAGTTHLAGATVVPVTLGGKPVLDLAGIEAAYKKEADARNANNLMVALLERGRYGDAAAVSAKLPNKELSPVTANNKAVALGAAGEYRMAQTLFSKAAGVPAARRNEGVAMLRSGQYAEASKLLSPYDDRDAVIASLNAGAYQQAAAQTHTGEADAAMLYLRAVAYSGLGDRQATLRTLQAACKADNSLKRRAATQPEFAPFQGDETFKAIIE